MFAIPFGRIFWKEYRANRSLWLVCLLVGVLIQAISWSTILNQSDRANFIIGGATLVLIMYVTGCGAIMFASEREDGTSDWLRSLAAPPLPMLLAKSAFAIVSTSVLQLALIICSIILVAGSKPEGWWPLMIPFGLIVLVWPGFGSLVSQRVVMAVFAAAAALFLPALLLQITVEAIFWVLYHRSTYGPQPWHLIWWVNGLTIFTVNCWLGWRWCHGNYVDGALLENCLSGVHERWGKLLHRTSEPQRLPLHIEYDQTWRRTWQRLIWQERLRSGLPILLLKTVCVMSVMQVVLLMFAHPNSGSVGLLSFCIWATCGVTPLVMGLLSFQVDPSRQQPHFLVNRGISHSSLWLAKQYVWLPRAIYIPLAMSAVAILSICLTGEHNRTELLPLVFPPPNLAQSQYDQHAWLGRVVWYVLLSYGCGQLASHLFRRTVIAIAASLFFLYVVGMWFCLIENCLLPLGWRLGLPFLAMMLITLWQMKPWFLEDQSWVRRGRIAASLVAIPFVLLTLLCCERVSQVYFAQRVDPVLIEQFDREVRAQSNWKLETAQSKSVQDRLGKFYSTDEDAIPSAAGEILELINQNQVLPVWKGLESSSIGWQALNNLQMLQQRKMILEIRSRQLMDEGRLAESLDYLLANLKLARSIGRSGVSGWINGAQFESTTIEKLVAWANHPKQTVDSLRAATTLIEKELDLYPSFTIAIVNSYIHDRNTWVLSSTTEVLDQLFEHDNTPKDARYLAAMMFLPPTERLRISLLLTRRAELDYASAVYSEAELASPEKAINFANVGFSFQSTDDELQKLISTTPLVRNNGRSRFNIETFIKNRQTARRAAMIRLNLIAYRLEHGTLPDRLVELLPAIEQKLPETKGVTLIDPWSGQMFDYYPTFLFSAGWAGQALFPANSKELILISFQGRLLGHPFSRIRREPPIRINADVPLDKNTYPDSVTGEIGHTLFPIPAPLKADAE